MNTLTPVAKLICVWMLGLALLGCQKSSSPKLPVGSLPLQFEYLKVQELLIVKATPATGDQWSARLRKDLNTFAWTLSEGKDGGPAADSLGNGSFLEHLLDTFHTLKVVKAAPEGSDISLGLSPPIFALRWKAVDLEYEVHIGAPYKNDRGLVEGVYAQVKIPGKDPSRVIVSGAALNMLENLDDFNRLRQERFWPQDPDEIDEIERVVGPKKIFYLQRAGDTWADSKNKPLRTNLNPLLEALAHVRITRFIDDPEENKNALLTAKAQQDTWIFKDRKGNPIHLKIYFKNSKWFGWSSLRPNAVFEIFERGGELLKEISTAATQFSGKK